MSAIGVLDVTEVHFSERLEKIKSTGYWRVNIRPAKFEESKIESLDRCWEIVKSCSVFLRGWPYPIVDDREKTFGDDWVQSGIDWEDKLELWRFYTSGQFIHYFPCMEDYQNMSALFGPKVKRRGLSIRSTLWRVTEIYEFAARLAQKKVFQDRVKMSIKLAEMKDRELFEWDQMIPWNHISLDNEILVESMLSVFDLLGSAYREKSIDKTMEILSKFNYKASRMTLASDQQRLLEKRLG